MKFILIALAFLIGFGTSEFRTSRVQLLDEINDYQREILIASRLLEEYTLNCATNMQGNFAPYVEHSTSRYENLVKKSENFHTSLVMSLSPTMKSQFLTFEKKWKYRTIK